jgi:hypothetical protein
MDAAALKELKFANIIALINSDRFTRFPIDLQLAVWHQFHLYMGEVEDEYKQYKAIESEFENETVK